jgi:4-amino-4-deoxy-L-arabinose transferase-like glycosyltransferase
MDGADRGTVPDSDWSRARRHLAAAAAVGLCLRLVFALTYWVDQPLTRDEREYLSLARSLARGDGFVYDEVVRTGPVEPFGRAPGYPLFLAVVGGGAVPVDAVPTSVKIAQSLVGVAGILLVALLARRLAGSRAARYAAWIAACYPPLVWIAAYAFSEAMFWPLGLLIAWLFDRHVSTRSGALVTGVLTGAGVLVRGALVPFIPFAVIWLLWRRQFVPAACFVLGVLVLLVPWSVRNAGHHGRMVVVASEGGVTFWTGNHPDAIGEGDLAANPRLRLSQQALRARYPGLTEEQMEPVYYREAFAWMRAHPLDWLRLEARKLFYLIVPIGPSYTLHSATYLIASVLSYGAVLPFSVIGLLRLGRRRARTPGLWLLAASAVAVCLVFFPQERFRVPILDPTLIVCASCAWALRPETSRA